MISVKGLQKHYGSVRAVDGITFEVRPGDVVGFLGPNGAGKTTTMQILTGYIPPTAGDVLLNGMDVTENPIEVKKLIGYLPENISLYEDLTVYEFLQFVGEIRGLNGKNRQAIREASEACGITEVVNRKIVELSKGYRQRVGLAQAIIHDPPFLVLDEPTTGLDPIQIAEIRDLIKRLGMEKTVILSTHILPEVEQTCNRVIVIHQGKIVADSTIEELKTGRSSSIEIEYRGEAPPEEFSRFGRVDIISSVDEYRKIRITPEGGSDPREEIFRFSVQKGLNLRELHLETKSLESIFRELTSGEEAEEN